MQSLFFSDLSYRTLAAHRRGASEGLRRLVLGLVCVAGLVLAGCSQ